MSESATPPISLGLDIAGAARLATKEKYGDWYRDPWGWPEVSVEFARTLSPKNIGVAHVDKRYSYADVPQFHIFDVPKSFIGIRPAVVQDAQSRLAYLSAALRIAPALHAQLPDWAFGWRMRAGKYSSQTDEWAEYRASQTGISSAHHAAQTDVTSFFASIEVPVLLARIRQKVGDGLPSQIIAEVLERHDGLQGRSGLPQRSTASALLAHASLSGVDDLIDDHLRRGGIENARRWMDDISLEGSQGALYGVLLDIQGYLRQVGLEINAQKTFLRSGRYSARRLDAEAQGLIEVRTVVETVETDYGEYENKYVDPSALRKAERRVLRRPKSTPRSQAALVLKSLVHHREFRRARKWMSAARYLPHAADKLSRYLAAAEAESPAGLDLETWFVKLQSSNWPHLDWVRAQHAIAVPSDKMGEPMLRILEEWLRTGDSLQQVAVAVQRLAKEDAARYRTVVSSRIDRVQDPLIVRVLALGLVMAGADRGDITAALRRHPCNSLTLMYLETKDWKLPKVSADFDPVGSESESA